MVMTMMLFCHSRMCIKILCLSNLCNVKPYIDWCGANRQSCLAKDGWGKETVKIDIMEPNVGFQVVFGGSTDVEVTSTYKIAGQCHAQRAKAVKFAGCKDQVNIFEVHDCGKAYKKQQAVEGERQIVERRRKWKNRQPCKEKGLSPSSYGL